MPRKKVLLTVTTYPLPSRSYDELVCTAGMQEDGSWIRIYPVPLTFLRGEKQVSGRLKSYKYTWIELDLVKRTDDFRPESFSPKNYSFSDIEILNSISTKNNWAERKKICLQKVYYNLNTLISDSKAPKNTSLATFKPTEIIGLDIVEEDKKEWKKEWTTMMDQISLMLESKDENASRKLIKKVPYKFFYKFKDEAGKVSRMMIEDWEIGQLYFNCLKKSGGDEEKATSLVHDKYYKDFSKKDIYLFLGTTKKYHLQRSKNPFVIIGVFYPNKEESVNQKTLF